MAQASRPSARAGGGDKVRAGWRICYTQVGGYAILGVPSAGLNQARGIQWLTLRGKVGLSTGSSLR